MPLFLEELQRRMNDIGASDLTVRLHTAAPTDAAPDNGLVTTGGGNFQNGATLAAANIGDADAMGRVATSAAVAFGTSTADIGACTHVSFKRGTENVSRHSIPSTTINTGDTFTLPSGTTIWDGDTS